MVNKIILLYADIHIRPERANRLQYLIKLSINYKITRCYKYVYKKYEVVVLPREQMCHVKLLRIVKWSEREGLVVEQTRKTASTVFIVMVYPNFFRPKQFIFVIEQFWLCIAVFYFSSVCCVNFVGRRRFLSQLWELSFYVCLHPSTLLVPTVWRFIG